MVLSSNSKAEYENLYNTCQIRSEQLAAIDSIVDKIIASKANYKAVERTTQVPWHVIATIHNLEGSLNFTTHLHNGDSLTSRTTHVPASRPRPPATPPFTWEESAKDALEYDGLTNWNDWSIAGIAYSLEKFNGFGYREFHPQIKSPYLWSFSNHFTRGKYADDGHFDPNLVSQQCGGMVLLKRMEEKEFIDFSNQDQDPSLKVTWFDLYRKEESGSTYSVVAAMAESTPIEVVELKESSTQDFIDFIGKYPTAKKFLIAPTSKPVPAPFNSNLIVVPPTGITLPNLTRILQWGVKGNDVKKLQKALIALGFNAGDVDGEFEDKTQRAVKAFQLKFGLLVDGEVGPLTWEKLGGKFTSGISVDASDPPYLRLAALAAAEAQQQLTWIDANSEAEKYLAPFRAPMLALDHIGTAKTFYNWCAAFVTYCCRQSGIDIPDQPDGFWATMALVESWEYWAKQQDYWYPKGSTIPQRGDIVTFDFDAPGAFNHIGIVRGYTPGSTMIQTAEGNKGDLNISGNFTRSLANVSGIVRIR
jgi:lysozyme family protein